MFIFPIINYIYAEIVETTFILSPYQLYLCQNRWNDIHFSQLQLFYAELVGMTLVIRNIKLFLCRNRWNDVYFPQYQLFIYRNRWNGVHFSRYQLFLCRDRRNGVHFSQCQQVLYLGGVFVGRVARFHFLFTQKSATGRGTELVKKTTLRRVLR